MEFECKYCFSDECDEALGMESGIISDRQITVSSSFDSENVGSSSAR